MSRFKTRLLTGVSAVMAVSAMAASANAATLQGGGSSLLAPYWTQAVGCWGPGVTGPAGNNGQFVNKGTPGTIVTPTPVPTTGCTTATDLIEYVSSGSGAGQAALFNHDGVTVLFGTHPNGLGGKVFTSGGIQYGLSDNALVDADVGVYTVGTNAAYTPPGGTTFTTAATYQGITIAAAKPLYGALVQFPVSIDPVAIAFNPLYDATHSLNLTGGVLKLDKTAYCGIFAHTITDWNNSILTSLNGGTSLTGGVSAAIHLVGRADSSGTTSIFTRHLSAVCGNTALWTTAGTTTLPASIQGFYSLQQGSGGVADQVHAAAGSIGYVGPDYVLPAVANTGLNSWNLPAAQLKNNAGQFRAVNTSGALLAAFGSATVPSGAARTNPLNWVQSTANSVPLANPTATNAYPIVGTTNFIGYTCYNETLNPGGLAALQSFLTFGGSTKAQGILTAAGLAALPSAWTSAIGATFLADDGNHLNFAKAGAGSTNPTCTVAGIIGG